MRPGRTTTVVVALALALAACGGGTAPPEAAPLNGQPEVGAWATWVLSSPDQVVVPPPPEEAAADLEAQELADLAGQRAPEVEAMVQRWDDQPAGSSWAELHMEVVAERAKDPVAASRGYGLMSVAVYDAMVSAWHWKHVYGRAAPNGLPTLAAPGPDPSYPSEHAAMAGAASRLLAYLNPELPAERFEQMAEAAAESRVWAGTNFRSDVEAGLALGREVAEAVIARAEADGSHDAWDGTRPDGIGTGPAYWEPPPGSVSPATQPLAGSWQTWVLESGDQLRPGPPPAYASPEFVDQARAVVDARAALTSDQKAIAKFWAGGQGTPLPPGIWNQITLDLIRSHQLSTPEAARALALLNLAQADAGIACWDTKYAYWSPRPENAIRDLGLDPGWAPLLRTPAFPSYSSGHATYSGAASEVLAYLFPDEADELRAKAEEAAMSRLYGGIHYPLDNQVGLEMGRSLGEMVVERARADGSG